ncbi:DUF11 domain-containing protein [Leucobacter insecticola]|uniref:DUF11 domain-containing protein n=1 Tax=Leucobacter insecticola TaxID=2714934 RepID=A0A6G8FHA3_9MICO|nr:DUF11 domain-containing protein [Leucobacter insecticola]QIM15734.1 DUF11 domain-containing protein [Leucobacter insecticola]
MHLRTNKSVSTSRWKYLRSIFTVLLVLVGLLLPGNAAFAAPDPVADDAPVLLVEWNPESAATRYSGQIFTYSGSVSCSTVTDVPCTDVTLTIPFPTDLVTPAGATAFANWVKSATQKLSSATASSPATISISGNNLVINLGTIPAGEYSYVTLTVTPPNYTTPNNSTWTLTPTASATGAEPVTGPSVTYKALATASAVLTKTYADGTTDTPIVYPGQLITYKIAAGRSTASVGIIGLDPAASVTVTDPLPANVEFVSCTAGCVENAGSVSWTLPQSSSLLSNLQVTVRVKSDVAANATLDNTASAVFTPLFGVPTFTKKTNTVSAVAKTAPDPAGIFKKLAIPNMGSDVPAGSGLINTTSDSGYRLTVKAQAVAFDYQMVDPLPCMNGSGSPYVSNSYDSSAVCSDPAFITERIKVTSLAAPVSYPVNLKITFADGSSANFTANATGSTYTVPAGKTVARVDVTGSMAVGTGQIAIDFLGKPKAGLGDGDILDNTAGFGAAVAGGGGSIDLVPGSGDLNIRERIGASIPWQSPKVDDTWQTLQVGSAGGRTSPGLPWSADFFSTQEQMTDSGAAALILPKGFTYASPIQMPVADEFEGQTRYLTLPGKGNWGTDMQRYISIDAGVAPGLYPYDIYVGFKDTTFDQCLMHDGTDVNLNNTAPTKQNQMIVDTTGIIGSTPGVPTTLCKVSGLILVKSDDPGAALTKQVITSESGGVWQQGQNALAEIGADGKVDFRLTWANYGSRDLSDVALYDVFPRATDDVTAFGKPRGSQMDLELQEITGVPATGWELSYSTADNPCRPEVLPTNPGCVDDWSTTAPDLSTVTAIRLKNTAPAKITTVLNIDLGFKAGALEIGEPLRAWNTAAMRNGYVAPGGGTNYLAPLETPRVGAAGQVDAVSELELVKTGSLDGTAAVGSDIDWSFTLTNWGNVVVKDLTLSDELEGLTNIEWDWAGSGVATEGELAPNESVSIRATSPISAALYPTGTVTNTAQASGTDSSGDPVDSNEAEATVTWPFVAAPALSLTKAGSVHGGTAATGGLIDWTFTLSNTGNVTVSDLELNDELAGLADVEWHWDEATVANAEELAPGESVDISATSPITWDVFANGGVENTATVTGSYNGSAVDSNEADAEVTWPFVAAPSVALKKSGALEGTEAENGTVKWTFEVTNTGNVALSDLVLNDELDGLSDVVWAWDDAADPTLIPGASVTGTATSPIDSALYKTGEVTNVATVGASAGSDTVTSEESEATVKWQAPEDGGSGTQGPGGGESGGAKPGNSGGTVNPQNPADTAGNGLATTGGEMQFALSLGVLLVALASGILLSRRKRA